MATPGAQIITNCATLTRDWIWGVSADGVWLEDSVSDFLSANCVGIFPHLISNDSNVINSHAIIVH